MLQTLTGNWRQGPVANMPAEERTRVKFQRDIRPTLFARLRTARLAAADRAAAPFRGHCRWRILAWLAAGALLSGCLGGPVRAPVPSNAIAVLSSDRSPAFTGVEREIKKRYPHRVEAYDLGGHDALPAELQKKLESPQWPVVVAIGLHAARAAQALPGKKVIFCQVFNYEQEDLVTPTMKGVAATPPVSELFRVWKTLSPKLRKVGVITGDRLDSLIDEARAAAAEYRIELVHVEVRSDRETLYAFKRMSPEIQGLWLVPDNRVLSREVIRDTMTHGMKEGKQLAVFSHQLLGLGGLVSAESSYDDIAEQVLARVRQAQEYAGVPGEAVVPLSKANIRINKVMAGRLNLTIPRTLRGLARAS
jgi:ABC-type uncharacterized transport system substrate-binding protein